MSAHAKASLVVSSWYGDLGGGELRLLDHVRNTRFPKAQIRALLNAPGDLDLALRELGVRTHVIRWKAGQSWLARQVHWYGAKLRATLRLLGTPRGVFVANTFPDLETTGRVAAALGWTVVWRARADTFTEVHQWPPKRLHELVRFLNRRVARIVATTHYEARLMRAAGVAPDKIFVVHNGVDLDRYADESAGTALRAEAGWGAGEFVIAFVARMVPQKGWEVLFEAVAQARAAGVPVKVLAAGDTTLMDGDPDAYRRSLRDQASRLGLADHIRFLGFRSDVFAVMKAADAFVLASRIEPFGTTVIEAMAAGRAVIASDLPGPRESVIDEKTGLFFPAGEAEALAAAMGRLAADRELCWRLGQAGRERAERVFDLQHNIDELDCLCTDLATTTWQSTDCESRKNNDDREK